MLRWVFVCLLAGGGLSGQGTAGFPVKRVVLYKNGVGYFEHAGKVTGNQDVRVTFTSGQLNDVLKSLTVLDLGGGRITGVNYGSEGPLDRRLSEMRLPTGEKTTLTEFLGGLRGAKLEVRSGTASAAGRLLSIERKTRMGGGATLEVDYMSLLTEHGEVKTVELSSGYSVKFAEAGLASKLERYLNLISGEREPDVRQLTVSTAGTGDREVFVSYISEVPIWKTTYRLVLDKSKSLLQGWAIVDNTVGEDWKNVQLSLVAGAPQSFIQKLSQPYFARRPEVGLPEAFNPAPQTYQATLMTGRAQVAGVVRDPSGAAVAGAVVRAFTPSGERLGEVTTDGNGVYGFQSLPDGDVRLEVSSAGFQIARVNGVPVRGGQRNTADVVLNVGSVTEAVEVSATAQGLQTSIAATAGSRSAGSGGALGSGRGLGGIGTGRGGGVGYGTGGGVGGGVFRAGTSSIAAAANAQELGDLFEYRLKNAVTIAKNQSALVPIVQADVKAERVSIWNSAGMGPRPRRGVWLTNSSGATLDGGSFSVIDGEAFAGEGLIDPIRPEERRLISYATDLALHASSRQENEQQRVTRVRVAKGTITFNSEMREKTTYTFRNEDPQPRTMIVEHPVRTGYVQRGGPEPVETTAQWKRFRLALASKQTESLVIEEARPITESAGVTSLGESMIALYVTQGKFSPAIAKAMRDVLTAKAEVERLSLMDDALEAERDAIFDDQQRVRENVKSLKGTPEEKALLQRYTQKLNQQEDRLEALRKEREELEKKADAAQEELDRRINEAEFDVDLTKP